MTNPDLEILAGYSPPEGALTFPAELVFPGVGLAFLVVAALPVVLALRRRRAGRASRPALLLAGTGALGALTCLWWTIAPVILNDGWVVSEVLSGSRSGTTCMYEAISSLTPYGWNTVACTARSREYVAWLFGAAVVISGGVTILVQHLTSRGRGSAGREDVRTSMTGRTSDVGTS